MTATAAPASSNVRARLDWATALGWAVIGLTTFLWMRVTVGALALRDLIGDYEAAYGPLSIRDGHVVEEGRLGISLPALRELDQALVDTADYFYPFGVAVLIVLAAIWCGGAAAALRQRPRWRNLAWGTAAAVLVVQLLLLAGPIYQMVVITE
ncbi:MAG: hypothetical protein GY929_06005 [Actinomycetia bacterium]|nr:hypothetical protein [Actinomycetes bacterium]